MLKLWLHLCGVVVALLLTAGVALAQAFTVEQVMSAPFPLELTAARSAPRVAWVFDSKGERNVWMADAPEFAPRQMTHYQGDDGQQIASVRLTPNGKTLLYARGSEVNKQGTSANPISLPKMPKQEVWAVDATGGQPRLLGEIGCAGEGCEDIQLSSDAKNAVWAAKTHLWIAAIDGKKKAEQLDELAGESDMPRWSPDSTRIAFRSKRGDHSFIAVLELATHKITYLAPSVSRDAVPRWSGDGKHVAFIRQPGLEFKQPLIPVKPSPWSLWIADVNSGEGRELFHSGSAMEDSLPLFAAQSFHFTDGGRIVFASEKDGRNHLYSIPAEGGSPQILTPGDFDVEDVQLSADRRNVLYTSNQNDVDRRHIWRVSAAGGPPQALTSGETIEVNPVELSDGKTVFCLGSSATSPLMPYRVTSSSGRELIGKIPPEFPQAQLVSPKQVVFKSADGLEIHGQLFAPKEQKGRGPALIFTHGGPIRQMLLGFHYMQYYHNAYAENQYLASKGYTVLSVNYRLGIMYGRPFRQPANSVWRGASEYQDVLAGAKFLQTLETVDPNRIGLWGGSYGGFLTAMGLARNSDIFKAGVDFHGVHDWAVFLPEWAAEVDAIRDIETAPDVKEARELAFKSSPVASLANWRSPVLLVHGDDDRNVPFQQTTDLIERLRAQKVDVSELVMPDEIHDFLRWSSWLRVYTATAEYFDRRLAQKP
jgi:dipeptidyl aminopeptidase/acylaminoacyl peptidase